MNVVNRNILDDPELFDDSLGYDDETGVQFASGLTASERKNATIIYRLFNELMGLCIVRGDPGTGKDLFGNYISFMIKHYFPWKRILRDERPRKVYGGYAGLFNPDVLHKDLAAMSEVARGTIKESGAPGAYLNALSSAAEDWARGHEVLLKNSVLYLTEFWKYCYNREAHSPMNKTMGAIHKLKRHLDVLVLGTVQIVSDLDKKTCLKWVDWEVACTKQHGNLTGYVYYIQKVHYNERMNIMEPLGKPFPLVVDAGKPQSWIGDGIIKLRKPDYLPENEDERVVLTAIKAGYNKYEDIVNIITSYGDMNENEILTTIKLLGLKILFRRPKMVLDYPCYYKLYNSKSAVALTTKVKLDG